MSEEEQITRVFIGGKVWEGLGTEEGKDLEEIGKRIEMDEVYRLFFKTLAICNDCSTRKRDGEKTVEYLGEDYDLLTTDCAQSSGVVLDDYDWKEGKKFLRIDHSAEKECWVVLGVCKKKTMFTYVAQRVDDEGYAVGEAMAFTKFWGKEVPVEEGSIEDVRSQLKVENSDNEFPLFVYVAHRTLSEAECEKVKEVHGKDYDDERTRSESTEKLYAQEVEKDMTLLGCVEIDLVTEKKKHGGLEVIFKKVFLVILFVIVVLYVSFIVFGRVFGEGDDDFVEESRSDDI